MTEKKKFKTISSRGIVISLNRANGESVVENYFGSATLTRAESILWFAARFDVVTPDELANRYYQTFDTLGIANVDIQEPFLSLLDKGFIVYGNDYSKRDTIYRMLCQGVLTASAHFGYKGENVTTYSSIINFDPVPQAEPIEVSGPDKAQADHIAQMIANDKWTFSELVRNIDQNYPASITRIDVLKKSINHNGKIIELFPSIDPAPVPLKDKYYQTDIGRDTAVIVAKLIISRRIILM